MVGDIVILILQIEGNAKNYSNNKMINCSFEEEKNRTVHIVIKNTVGGVRCTL